MPHPLLTTTARLAIPLLAAAAIVIPAVGTPAPGLPIDTGTPDVRATLSRPLELPGAVPGDVVTSALTITSGGITTRTSVTLTATDPDGKHLGEALLVHATPVDHPDHCTTELAITNPTRGIPTDGISVLDDLRIDRDQSATVCIRVELPRTAGNQYQAATTSLDVITSHTQEIPA